MDKINIQTTPGQNTINVRQGDLPEPIKTLLPRPFVHHTVLSGPATYAQALKDGKIKLAHNGGGQLPELRQLVTYNVDQGVIKLDLYHNSDLECLVMGLLVLNPDLEKLSVNSDKVWKVKELAKFIKMNRFLFQDRDRAFDLQSSLQQLTVRVNQVVDNKDDGRGNKDVRNLQEVTTDLPLDFNVFMPIYVGTDPVSFKIEIGVDVRDGGIDVWFESAELAELKQDLKEKLINEQLKHLDILDLPILELQH